MATVRIQVRRGTAAQWTSANPTLAAGELGVESDTNLFKFGNGSSTWTALAYANNSDVAIGEISQDAVNTALTMGAGLTKTYNDGANTITIAVDSAIVTTVAGTQTLTNKTLTSPVINSPTGITKSDVGLANVDNTTDASKPISTAAQTALDLKAPLASPTFTGTVAGVTKAHVGLANVDNTSDANKPVSSATQTVLDTKASNADLTNHEADTTSVHGITDTSLLATKAYADASAASAVAGIISTAPATLDTLAEISTALGADANLSVTLTNAISTKLALAGGTMTGAIDMGTTNKITNLAQPTVSSDAATKSYADTAVSDHNADTTSVHGIADTSLLATTSNLSGAITDHNADTTSVHGIADTAELATKTYSNDGITNHNSDTTNVHGIVDTVALATKTYADTAVSTHSDDTTNVHGIVDTAALATKTYADTAVSTHSSDTTDVHGIADTSLLSTKAYADAAVAVEVTNRGTAISTAIGTEVNDRNSAIGTHNADTTDVHGIANTANLVATTDTGTVTSTMIANGTIVDADVNASAAIAQSKISGLTSDLADKAPLASPTFTGTVTLPSGTVTSGMILDGTIVDADVNASAAIAQSKISGLTSDLATKAPLASPTFTGTVTIPSGASISGFAPLDSAALTGTPTAPLATTGTNTTQLATTSFVQQELSILTTGAPALLNTLDELAAALGDDANYAATITTALSTKAPLASPTFTGTVTLPSGTVTSGMILDGTIVDADVNASAAIAQSKISGLTSDLAAKAPLASPTFTGTVTVAASGVAFTDGTQTKAGVPSLTTIATATSGAYNLSSGGLTLRDQLIPIGGTHVITVPTNTTTAYPVGTTISFYQSAGTGGSFAAADGTVTILSTPGSTLRALYSSATLTKVATNTWLLAGDLKA